MRELTSHKVNGLNEALKIEVLDEPGPGNACHSYSIWYLTPPEVPGLQVCGIESFVVPIRFQNGPIAEAGVNGISNEALLAIVEDRLRGFQSGEYACRENAVALTKIQEAMRWLEIRTQGRVARGAVTLNGLEIDWIPPFPPRAD